MARSLRYLEIFPITTRYLRVLRTCVVTPGMRRVTLGGEQLKAHVALNGFPVEEFRSTGFDDEFKLLIKHADADVAVGPTQADGILNWPRGDEHLLMRTYTVRRFDPEAGELDVDLVDHGDGPAVNWARTAQPGDIMQVAGPKSSATHPRGADWVLVGADETALPAVARWLEEWPEDARGQVFIEVGEESHKQELIVPEGVELTWLLRNGAAAGTTTLLFDALKAATWWEGKVFAWVAGEANSLTPIRRWLRKDKELPRDQVEVTGYWKRQEEQDAPVTDLTDSFHELTEIMPGFALRVAATLGLGPALGSATRTLEELVSHTGANPVGLSKLLRYLGALNIVSQSPDGWALTVLGRELDNDHNAEHLNLRGAHAHREMQVTKTLFDAILHGNHPGYEETPEHMKERVDDESSFSGYISGALANDPAFGKLRTLRIAGRGAPVFAQAIVEKHASLDVTVLGSRAEIEAYKVVESGLKYATELENADAVLLLDSLNARPDFEAAAVLKEAAQHGRLYCFADVLNPELAHDHDYEDDLADFALNGGGMRTAEEFAALFAKAGLNEPQRRTIGWGYTLFEFDA